jgi:dipeptidyl aminopeptidase/acylaminoacyl peptidase
MKRVLVISLWLFLLCSLALASSSSPDDRSITDPKSITSESNSGAHPVPIDDLYYTRESSGPAWSPDGREVAFTTDLAGRANIWKVNSSGGWPMQLTQSDDRQYAATWSPDGKWIIFSRTAAEMRCGTCTPSLVMAAQSST